MLAGAAATAGALLILALLTGAAALRMTSDEPERADTARIAAVDHAPGAAAARPPLTTLRARPPAEPEAIARPPSVPLPNVQDLPLTLSLAASPPLEPGDRLRITLSFYYCEYLGEAVGDGGLFCGLMRDGTVVYAGAAACDIAYLGQIFRIEGDPTGRIYRCADTGSAIGGSHRDIWFQTNTEGWDWLQTIGQSAVIEILP